MATPKRSAVNSGRRPRKWRTKLADRLVPPAPHGDSAPLVELDAFAGLIEVEKLQPEQFVQLLDTLHMLGAAGAGVEISSMSTPALISVVRRASREQLAALAEHDELRAVFLHEIFRRMSELLIEEKVRGVDIVVGWRFPRAGEEDSFDRYQLAIAEQHCVTGPDLGLTPDTTITLAFEDFIRVGTGATAVATVFVTGKVKVKGEYGTAVRLLTYFDLPEPD